MVYGQGIQRQGRAERSVCWFSFFPVTGPFMSVVVYITKHDRSLSQLANLDKHSYMAVDVVDYPLLRPFQIQHPLAF